MTTSISTAARGLVPVAARYARGLIPVVALFALFLSMGGSWHLASAAPPPVMASLKPSADDDGERPAKKSAKDLNGKVNINTATEEQLMMLPTVGPAKA